MTRSRHHATLPAYHRGLPADRWRKALGGKRGTPGRTNTPGS